jgi:urease accessory protein
MRCRLIVRAGTWDPSTATDRIEAGYDDRHRRRITLRTESGADLMLDFPEAQHIRDGDGLVVEDGAIVIVHARPERLHEVTTSDQELLLRLAWHLGNRHLPTSLRSGRILIRADHVIAAMVVGLGGAVRDVTEPFDPETGAYAH